MISLTEELLKKATESAAEKTAASETKTAEPKKRGRKKSVETAGAEVKNKKKPGRKADPEKAAKKKEKEAAKKIAKTEKTAKVSKTSKAAANVVFQFAGKDIDANALVERAKAVYAQNNKDKAKTINIYVNAVEGMVYPVINGASQEGFKI
jgi:hypothetical protein